ncbi:MAG TPA: lysozyme [bacterium]|nr:lysozyme [bacterium]
MRLSPAGRSFVEGQESFLPFVYDDHDDAPIAPPVGSFGGGRPAEQAIGYPTVGWGHKLRPGEQYPAGITREQGDMLFERDMAPAEAAVNAHVQAPISQNAFDALCSFAFNCGLTAFACSTLVRRINANDPDASEEFGWWVHGRGGVVLPILVARRTEERALFLAPDAPRPHEAPRRPRRRARGHRVPRPDRPAPARRRDAGADR